MKIEIKNLVVNYGKRQILSGINYSIEDGKHVLIGPNGSGKTTLIKCILEMVKYDGIIEREIGTYLSTNLIEVYKLMNLSVNDIIKIYSEIYSINYEKIIQMIKNFRMERILKNKINKLSTGESKILGFSVAFNLNSDLMLLDEPFEGLDISRKNILIKILNENSINYFLITHELELMNNLRTDGFSFLLNGKIYGEYKINNVQDLYLSKREVGNIIDTINNENGKYYITYGQGEIPITSFRTIEEILEVY